MKILFVGDFSGSSTGYGKINKELLTRFHRDGYEVAELALGESNDAVPWKVFSNLPGTDEENARYQSDPRNSNGKWKFEKTLLDFMPNTVFGNSDPYFIEYQMHSPYREYFNWLVSATVDGLPQHTQWIEIFKNADGLTTYTDWAKNALEEYGLEVHAVTSPVASDHYKILPRDDIETLKKNLGLSGNKIIGTVMRNQPRKLFDKIFEAFKKYQTIHPKSLLYCHTSYPDGGWDFPEMLLKYKIANSVLFTYLCESCGQVFPKFFQNSISLCPLCQGTCRISGSGDAITEDILCRVYNIFDIYLHMANREGFGIPQAEAAACGLPVVTTKYAGMNDVCNKLNAKGVHVEEYFNLNMQMNEAIPDINEAVRFLLIETEKPSKREENREIYLKNYSWEKTYQNYKKIVDQMPKKQWQAKQIKPIPNMPTNGAFTNHQFVEYLYSAVLNQPMDYCSYRMANDLSLGYTHGGLAGNYFTENHNESQITDFSPEKAYRICYERQKFKNYWQTLLNRKLQEDESLRK